MNIAILVASILTLLASLLTLSVTLGVALLLTLRKSPPPGGIDLDRLTDGVAAKLVPSLKKQALQAGLQEASMRRNGATPNPVAEAPLEG